MLCENEVEWKGIYRERGEGRFGHFRVGLGGKMFLKFDGRWGLWGRVGGCEW